MSTRRCVILSRIGARVINFASGSKGNCTLIELGGKRFLVDCGISHRHLTAELSGAGVEVGDIDAVFVTHLHSDHFSAFPIWYRLTNLRFVLPELVLNAVARGGRRAALGHRLFAFRPGENYAFNGVYVSPQPVSHDAPETVSICFESAGTKIVCITDLGTTTDQHAAVCDGADLILLEANHEPDMVRASDYPAFLQRRILGDTGHLSNMQALAFVQSLRHPPRQVMFGHLSENNNTPEALLQRLSETGLSGSFEQVHIASQRRPTEALL